ncbi:helix-turn-helix protein [Paraburkholderia rhizosphaerae]|uniref:Helix-turn-helix protein n=1 Tax=Paraburkholderia rhizosphaerae TaxID=480658 RepID=A0A4R8LLM9_9BURK|nr:helix-turn-helix protein [Paraburkholderia rhizosphaerae]
MLAAAGVVDDKTVTTHWRYANRLQQRYPALRVQPDALYVDEGQVLTSAGSAAGLDMLLHLVRRDYGSAVANRVAQRLVVPPHRDGGQAQFVPRPMPRDESSRLAKLMDWVRKHPALPHSVESLAAKASMSTRTLQRQFRDATGMGPYEWVVRERVAIARDLLESKPDVPIARIVELAGFGSEESLRRHFRLVARTSPAAYRKRFGARDSASNVDCANAVLMEKN